MGDMKQAPRDISRIQPFCDRLAKAWEQLPDQRFGQLMMNLLSDYRREHGRDVFYVEDDALIETIEAYCARLTGKHDA